MVYRPNIIEVIINIDHHVKFVNLSIVFVATEATDKLDRLRLTASAYE